MSGPGLDAQPQFPGRGCLGLCSGSPLGPSSGPESEPWATGVQAPELPSGQLWDLGSGSRVPLMAFSVGI